MTLRRRPLASTLVGLAVLFAVVAMTGSPSGAGAPTPTGPSTTADPTGTSSQQGRTSPPAPPSANATAEGPRVTVHIQSEANVQFRVSLSDGTILSTGLTDSTGSASPSFDLAAGDYTLEVLAYDPPFASDVTLVPVAVEGPPPSPPGVDIGAANAADNFTKVNVSGEAGSAFRIRITKGGATEADVSGTLDGEGKGSREILLANGTWDYSITLSNGRGESEPASGQFNVSIGRPPTPAISVVSDLGANPISVKVTGPASGSAVVRATGPGTAVSEEIDLDTLGEGTADLQVDADGDWTITATAVDFQGQESEAATLDGAVMVDTQPPPLELEAAGGEGFSYRIITDVGTHISVDSETVPLREEFTTDAEVTERTISVPEGTHTVRVTATDPAGNTFFKTLDITVGGGGGLNVFLILIVLLVVAFVAFAVMKRQEAIDWWNNRQYH